MRTCPGSMTWSHGFATLLSASTARALWLSALAVRCGLFTCRLSFPKNSSVQLCGTIPMILSYSGTKDPMCLHTHCLTALNTAQKHASLPSLETSLPAVSPATSGQRVIPVQPANINFRQCNCPMESLDARCWVCRCWLERLGARWARTPHSALCLPVRPSKPSPVPECMGPSASETLWHF